MTENTHLFLLRNIFSAMHIVWCGVLLLMSACSELEEATLKDTGILVDFDLAMQGVNFDLVGDNNGLEQGNGIPDATEMALIAAILANPDFDLSSHGGVSYKQVRQAYEITLQNTKKDLWLISQVWGTAPEVVAGYIMLGEISFQRIREMTSAFGAELKSDYSAALALDKYLSAGGDADGDGISNLAEYLAHAGGERSAYLQAVLSPMIKAGRSEDVAHTPEPRKLVVGIVLYPGFEVLDVFGPLEIWAYIEQFKVVLIAEQAGAVVSAQQVSVLADYSFEMAPALDILMVPGGAGTLTQLHNENLLQFIRQADRQTRYTSSVCTGSALLAKAGVLAGQRATSNKRFFFLSQQHGPDTNWIEQARWVESGKYFTSSGVSAGIDMALGLVAHLYGNSKAEALASAVEYSWQQDADSDPFSVFIQRADIETGEPPHLVGSFPITNSQLTQSPHYLQLRFNRLPNVAKSQIQLITADGHIVSLSGLHVMGANELMISVNDTLSGHYRLFWSVYFSPDTEILSGSLPFSVLESSTPL